jgi:hypothetical protein
MSLFSRACMTAIALAATFPLMLAQPAEARDRHEGGGNRSFSNSNVSGGNMPRDRHWKRKHDARNNDRDGRRDRHWNRDRNFAGRDVQGGNVFTDNWRWRRDWRAGNDWGQRNHWGQRNDWRNDANRRHAGSIWRNDAWRGPARPYYARPYYEGSARPYYAGQSAGREHFTNNFYGGSISAYEDPGNGNYFYVDNYYDEIGDAGGNYMPALRAVNNAKVVVVTPETETAACSFEAGVCVIRP